MIDHNELLKLGFKDTGDPNWVGYCKKMQEEIRVHVHRHRRNQKNFTLTICEGSGNDDDEITLNTNCTIQQVEQLIKMIENNKT